MAYIQAESPSLRNTNVNEFFLNGTAVLPRPEQLDVLIVGARILSLQTESKDVTNQKD